MKKCLLYIFLFLCLVNIIGYSQTSSDKHTIAVFVPLYLDSAFDKLGNYRFDASFPKFLNPGLEFYEGAQLALDSLKAEGMHLDVHVYDTRSINNPVAHILQSADFQNAELIIGYVTTSELKIIADMASQKHIPFINTNLPNDGNVKNNPDFVVLNSTLKTHCEGIYKFLQRNYATAEIRVLRKKGFLEDRLKNYFIDIEKNTSSVPLKLEYTDLIEPILSKQLLPYLDSTKQNVFIAGTLDEKFAKNLCSQLADFAKTYPIIVIGMPTWDNIDFSQTDYKNLTIIYSTPFYSDPNNDLVKSIQQYFKTKFYSRPSDMVFRGYETTWHFAKLLQQYGKDLGGSIGEKKFNVFSSFDIQPVFLSKENMTLDYFENKKLYFIKKLDAVSTTVF